MVDEPTARKILYKLIDVITEYCDEISEGTMVFVVCDMDNYIKSLVHKSEIDKDE